MLPAMIEIAALVCVTCGGPLGAVKAVPAVIECEFCGAVIAVSNDAATVTKPGSPDELREAKHRAAAKAFFDALVALLEAGRSPYDALREASAAHLGTGGQTEAVARVTIALATDFERESGVAVLTQPNVLARIAQCYLGVFEKLGSAPEFELNLPFIAASASGPVHFLRRVTPAQLAELARRDPNAPPPAPAVVAEPPKKKKKWGLF